MRKIFFLFPLTSMSISILNLAFGNIFETLLWLMASIFIGLIALPLAFKTNEKEVPVYQVFIPFLTIPVFFSAFAMMDFNRLDFLTQPQAIIYGIFAGIAFISLLMLLIGPNKY